jgi:hypothetical protein
MIYVIRKSNGWFVVRASGSDNTVIAGPYGWYWCAAFVSMFAF